MAESAPWKIRVRCCGDSSRQTPQATSANPNGPRRIDRATRAPSKNLNNIAIAYPARQQLQTRPEGVGSGESASTQLRSDAGQRFDATPVGYADRMTEDTDREATYEDGQPIDDRNGDSSGAPEHHPILDPADPDDRLDSAKDTTDKSSPNSGRTSD